MYYLNKRQIEIITYLLEAGSPVSVKDVASGFKVSVRTVRYDLELIDDWLNENNATLVKIPNKGIELKVPTDRTLLLEKLKFLSIENRVLSDRERIRYIVLELITAEGALTIEALSEHLYLSRNTVIKILKDVKTYLQQNGLDIEKMRGKGMMISGPETVKRSLMLELFLDTVSINNVLLSVKNREQYRDLIELWENNYKSLSMKHVEEIFQLLLNIENEHGFYLTDVALTKLVFYLTITMNRISHGHKIEVGKPQIRQESEYGIAKLIVEALANYDVVFDEAEIDEIALHIIGSKSYSTLNTLKSMTLSESFSEEVIASTMHIIKYFEREIRLQFSSDKQLVNGLALHLKSALSRIKNNRKINNKYTLDIKEKFPLVFQIARESVIYLETLYNMSIHDEEIGYIALHIRAAYERLSSKVSRASALVICTEGVSVLSMLTTRLKEIIPELNIIETCSVYDYEKYKKEIDLVITTSDFRLGNIDVMRVSPFLTNDEVYGIRQFIIRLNKFRQIYKYSQEGHQLGGKVVMLEDILSEDTMRLGVAVNNWEDAIREAGALLVARQSVEQAYIENMINAVKDLGPYIVIMPGVAFAHARPDSTVHETCMSMITLEKPVNFGSAQNDPVSIVFAFGAPNNHEHLNALQDLAKFLSVEENILLLKEEKNKEQILRKILE